MMERTAIKTLVWTDITGKTVISEVGKPIGTLWGMFALTLVGLAYLLIQLHKARYELDFLIRCLCRKENESGDD
jgi:hypothetical protein